MIVGMFIATQTKIVAAARDDLDIVLHYIAAHGIFSIIPGSEVLAVTHAHDRRPADLTCSLPCCILGSLGTTAIVGALVLQTQGMTGFVCNGLGYFLYAIAQ
jgi:hypothetical protein